jgi:hypothetical protein
LEPPNTTNVIKQLFARLPFLLPQYIIIQFLVIFKKKIYTVSCWILVDKII